MTYQGYSTAAASSAQNYGGMEGQGFLNAMHFGQQNTASNYGILPYSYPPNDGLIQNVQFENGNARNRHSGPKPWGKDGGDYPRNSYNDRKEATNQMERNMDAIQRADSMFVENQDDRFNKLRDRRKVFRTATSGGSLSRQESFDNEGQSVEQPLPNQSNFNRSIDGRSRFNNGKIIDKPPNLDLKDITFSNEQQKARFVPISKELADRVATSNLSNEAKAFIPKDIPTTEQPATTSAETEEQASVVTTTAPSTSTVAAAPTEDKATVSDDSKSSQNTVTNVTDRKPLFHNKQNVNTNMKNFNTANNFRHNRDNRQGYRNTMGSGGVHDYKGGIRNERDDRSFRTYFQREPASPTVQVIQLFFF